MFTPRLLWKPKTKQSRGGRSPSPRSGRRCQVHSLGFIFPDVGRWWELSLCGRRMWWVCVMYKESVQACTRGDVFVYCVRPFAHRGTHALGLGSVGVQHRFVSGHTGSWEGGSRVLWSWYSDMVALDTLCCPVPSPWGGAGPECAFFPPIATCRQSTWPGPWPLCAICPRCLIFTLNL